MVSCRRSITLRRTAIAASTTLIAGVLAVTPAQPSAAVSSTVFQGSFVCGSGGAPLAGARVELWEIWGTWLPKVAPNAQLRHVVQADSNGGWGFRVTGGETNWFVRVVLTSAQAEVSNFLVPWSFFADTDPNQNDVPLHDYGRQAVPGLECPLWTQMRDAALGYESDVGRRAPFGEVEAVYGSPAAGKPYTWYDEVRWPSGLSPAGSTPRHEFAHAVRHSLDGGFGHFFGDMVAFQYPQHHSATSCDQRTNPGFAFNEGWAQYWAGTKSTPCPGRPGDYSIERNVAGALRGLQRTCGLTRADMVQVLASNPGRIHSYEAFSNRTQCKPRLVVPPPGKASPERVTRKALTGALRDGRSWLRSVARDRDRLRAQLVTAVQAQAAPLPCVSRPCAEELRRAAEPWLVRAQLAHVDAVATAFAGLRKRAVVRTLLRRPVSATRYWDARRNKALAAGRSAALPHLDAAIAAVAAAPGAPSALHLGSADTLRALRAGVAASDPQALTGLPWQAPADPRRTGPTPAGIQLSDVVGPVETTTTVLDGCSSPATGSTKWFPNPDDDNYPGPPAFRGSTTPALPGTAVRVVYRHDTPTGERTIVGTAVTDAAGSFRHGLSQSEWAAGYGRLWTVHAEFAGDAYRTPSTSGFCRLDATYP